MLLSTLLDRFNEPETLKMAKLGRLLRSEGKDITDLSLGEPDFDTPQHIKNAAIDAINKNYSHYTPVSGFLDLKEAVCFKLKRDNNLGYRAGANCGINRCKTMYCKCGFSYCRQRR